jgi:hypothetical protein
LGYLDLGASGCLLGPEQPQKIRLGAPLPHACAPLAQPIEIIHELARTTQL